MLARRPLTGVLLQPSNGRSITRCSSRVLAVPAKGTSVKAVAGPVLETASNGAKRTTPDIAQNPRDGTASEQALEAPKKQFNWFKQWYPVAILEDLDPRLPMPTKLLGLDLAIWWDSNANQWRAFQDRCPHRLAPLSEGIIDATSGHLYCSYHGWTFNGDGACTSVPQLPAGQPLNGPGSCVSSYPTRSAEGLLWVWPDASPTALIESSDPDAWPGLAPELDEFGDAAFSKALGKHRWYARDMPSPYLAAKENVYNDVSHDAVLHHGVGPGAKRSAAKPTQMVLTEMTPVGYTVSEVSGAFQDTTRFPCGARRTFSAGAGLAYVVPTAVGRCRQFHTGLQTKSALQAAAAGGSSSKTLSLTLPGVRMLVKSKVNQLKPTWMQHMFSHVLIDADMAIQARVNYNRAINGRVYMPAAADAAPAAFMRWLKEYGGGGPPVAKLKDPYVGHALPEPLPRQQLLDRFTQHTQHCKSCRTAYQQTTAAHKAAGVLALLAGSVALAMMTLAAAGAVLVTPGAAAVASANATAGSAGSTWALGAVFSALAGLLCGVYVALGKLIEKFVFVDYDIKHVGKRPGH